ITTLEILNVYHMASTAPHLIEGIADDVLQPKRQAELETLVMRLARYKPTKILVEVLPEREADLNARYRDYREGRHTLSQDEVEQIGFRLAKKLNHERLYAVNDYNETGAKVLEGDPFEKYRQNQAFQRILAEGQEQERKMQDRLHRDGLLPLLLYMNSPEFMQQDHHVYLRLAQLGEEIALWVQWWYGRNLKILLNILRVTEPGDRLLLIIGSGHGYLLRQMAKESGKLRLIDVRRYLRGESDRGLRKLKEWKVVI
ncbi:MAG: hypothetical protein K6T71_03645, partial [Candidatus Bipolaricaulota bacterium]|nr:hypothetical protein [Candidatus Bipolaricaulota bacterium]